MSSFFKKPSWAKTNTGSSTEFYRRSNQVYSDILASESKEDEEGQGDNPELGKPKVYDSQRQKRRRSIELEDTQVESVTKSTLSTSNTNYGGSTENDEVHKNPLSQHAIQSSSPNTRSRRSNKPFPSDTLVHSNSRDTDIHIMSSEPHVVANERMTDEDVDNLGDRDLGSDEEFPELARKARERARNRLHASTSHSVPDAPGAAPYPDKSTAISRTSHKTASPNHTAIKDPIVHIFITSEIRNTKSLIVQRKFSQDLRDVRKAWCHRQGFDDEMTASVFLTWKEKRLFDVTTCKSLGIKPENESNFSFNSDGGSAEDDCIKVHMEAMTRDILESRKRQAGMIPSDKSERIQEEDGSSAIRETLSGVSIRITLKSPNLDDFKIKVRQLTPISTIIDKFREARKLPPDRSIHLYFDGERLERNSSVQENDIADLDAIDARIGG